MGSYYPYYLFFSTKIRGRSMNQHTISHIPSVLALAGALVLSCGISRAQDHDPVKTTVQTSQEWRPTLDTRTDAVMVYGVRGNPSDQKRGYSFEERVDSWRQRGYTVHYMTGIAWGEYQDYFTGQWDGEWHLDEGQVTQQGDTIWHGHMVPYIVPSKSFLEYMKHEHIKKAIDQGIDALFLEEPEFWARAGYSEAFKKEWQAYYGTPWQPQHLSPQNTYLANKLKYHLYYRALNEVCSYAKEYGRSLGRDIKCYIPTHSLINYAQWHIVSPEASLASLPVIDGYIAQVWTGTSREPNYFNGKKKERVFETAYLEYGTMESMTAPTGRKIFFLTDPIEDRAKDWEDYRRNYQATFTAQLLYPAVNNYEVMPWPERIYEGLYKTSLESDEKQRIPADYATQMLVMVNTLRRMPKSNNTISGSSGVGILIENSLMFQSFPDHEGYSDPQFSNYYGLALPLLKRGIPVQMVHMENLSYPQTLADIKVLLMTYANMKPTDPTAHEVLSKWVKSGGVLLFAGTDQDPFQTVQEWWNTSSKSYPTPSAHLFEHMGLPLTPSAGTYQVGKGYVCILRTDPKDFVLQQGGDEVLFTAVDKLYHRSTSSALECSNHLVLQRGAFDIIAVLDENENDAPYTVEGCFIDLYDPQLPVLSKKVVHPGQQALLINMARITDKRTPRVLASASREEQEAVRPGSYSYVAKSPTSTVNVSRVLLPEQPTHVIIDGKEAFDARLWDDTSHTYLLMHSNSPEGVSIKFEWGK